MAYFFAFLAPNGAGKTTTIRMLTTLLQPTSGRLQLNGLDPAKQKEEVRKHFGIVFQDPSLDQDLTLGKTWNCMACFITSRARCGVGERKCF
jgi:ABC-type multidrug transport system ATPase subunit